LGAQVEWSNVGTQMHRVTQNARGEHPVFQSPPLNAGQYFDVTVSAGTWYYHDSLGGAGNAFFYVYPLLRLTRSAHAERVAAVWATASSNTGRHYCGQWFMRRNGSRRAVRFGPTTKIGATLQRGQRLLDEHHKHFILRSGTSVQLQFRSGIGGASCPSPGIAPGWSESVLTPEVHL
jgi:hypothetical protein